MRQSHKIDHTPPTSPPADALWHDRSRGATGLLLGHAGLAAPPPAFLHLAVRHNFHGPPFDYVRLAAAAAASWLGVPGPGEPVLLAAGVLAAHHRLDIESVILV